MTILVRESTVTIRKPHRCWGCGDFLPAGTKAKASVSAAMGQLMTAYWCRKCDAFIATLRGDDAAYVSNGIDFKELTEFAEYPRTEEAR